MKLLIVEDDTATADYLSKGLSENGYAVEVAHDGTSGLHTALTGDHDAIILDAMLPHLDGFAVLSALRTARQTPVLMLSARGRTDDKLRGFDLGADDYLAKPFQFPELLARVRALLKRTGVAIRGNVLRAGAIELDAVRHRALRKGRSIALSAKEFALLHLFMRHPGEVLSRTEIASRVWDIHFDCNTNVVDVAVARLRGKLGEPGSDSIIQTVRGVGYVLKNPDHAE